MSKVIERTDDYLATPHGGRPPSDEAVKAATERYVEWGRRNGIKPSPEWESSHAPKIKLSTVSKR